MTTTSFNHVKVSGIKTVIPQHMINVEDELEFFDNNPKKLARAKKMVGYGRRYIADDLTTVTDMATDAAKKLMHEMGISTEEIDLLVFVSQKPDYKEPNNASVAHGMLGLKKECFALDINSGCSGYMQALLVAHALLEVGLGKKCLLLAGDIPSRTGSAQAKDARVFGDAASATILEYSSDVYKSFFVVGTDGSGFDKIICPFGGARLPLDVDILNLILQDGPFSWRAASDRIIKGEDVFRFTMDVAPQTIKQTLALAGWTDADVDLYAIHQANKQIVENIVSSAGVSVQKAPTDVFTKYANNSTNSLATLLCDQPQGKTWGNTILCGFGVGLSWGGGSNKSARFI